MEFNMNRPLCDCGNLCKPNGYRADGLTRRYYKLCSPCLRKKHKQGTPGARGSRDRQNIRRFYVNYKKDACEYCNFIPEHSCQLDIDHVDGNRSNNDPSNLQTLCANCHRLKAYLNWDYKVNLNHKNK